MPTYFPDPIAPCAPRTAAPPGACDCHVHVFPAARDYPVLESCTVLPGLHTLASYKDVMAVLGLQRAVIVQPGMIYGEDNRATLEAAQALGENGRAVGICLDEARLTSPTLEAWHAAGMRGLRINFWHDGRPDMEGFLRKLAGRIAEFGWHLEFYGDMGHYGEIGPALKRLPVPFVVGHFGLARVGTEHEREDTALLRDFLATRNAWIKLSGAYRVDLAGHPYESFKDLVRSLVEERLDRLVWGTNWPHLAVPGPSPGVYGAMPDDGLLFDTLLGWGLPADAIRSILAANPETLYGFPRAASSAETNGVREASRAGG